MYACTGKSYNFPLFPYIRKLCACALHTTNINMNWRECNFLRYRLRSVEGDETIPTERFIKIVRGRFFVFFFFFFSCVCVSICNGAHSSFCTFLVVLFCCCCCCCSYYCNAIIESIASPLPNTAMDGCNSNRKIYKTLHSTDTAFRSVLLISCSAHTPPFSY